MSNLLGKVKTPYSSIQIKRMIYLFINIKSIPFLLSSYCISLVDKAINVLQYSQNIW